MSLLLTPVADAMKLWYQSPPADWLEGLPVGTGRLAAMVQGSLAQHHVALNHEWLWKGVHRNRDNEVRSQLLAEVRRLLLEGRYAEGTRAANEAFGGRGGCSGLPGRVDSYQPAGDLYLDFEPQGITDYQRELDLATATATVSTGVGCERRICQTVAHLVEDLILVRVTQGENPFDCVAWLNRAQDADCELSFDTREGLLSMNGTIRGGLDFRVEACVWCRGGKMRVVDRRKLSLEGVREAILAINIGVSVDGRSAADECAERRLPFSVAWPELLEAHEREYQRHCGSITLDLEINEPALPTDERIQRARAGIPDPGLALLYFNYGRYLLCASSANALLPVNLQGKWNAELKPPWQSDYHHDINLQMAYWVAEPAGMQREMEALFQHIERFVPHARKAAMDLYGCRGVWFPLQADAWGRSTPEAYGWAVWVGAAPWLAQHMWWHYEYGQDPEFLKNRAYPFFKEVAVFYEDYLVEDEAGVLQIVPSQSPENRFVGGGDLPVTLGVSSTMDILLARELLGYAIRAAEILDVDSANRQKWTHMVAHLPPLKIGRQGQLQEWNDDFDEVEPSHRHVSHLVGLFPGDTLDPERMPELWHAAEVSLERRLATGGGHTGWSRAWVACLFARLGRAEDAWEHLNHLILDFATNTLLDLHPPRIFQIDGNLGGAAAVVEMLLQSYHGELHFLPALPAAWPNGKVSGLRARGGLVIGMEWCDGRLVRASMKGLANVDCTIIHAPWPCEILDSAHQRVAFRREGHRITFPLRRDEPIEMTVLNR